MTIKSMIRKWVRANFGESEVNDPSWNIDLLADYIESKLAKEPLKDKLNRWLDVLNYWFEHIEDYGDRYPDMKKMVKKFEQTIDEMYNLTKGK